MTEEKLHEYHGLIDPELDFEATREHFGTGSCNYGISETLLSNGEVAVYLHQQREGERVVSTTAGFRRACERGIVVCGYRVNPMGILKFLKGHKIRPIPNSERPRVELELVEKLGDNKPDYVDFWSNPK